MNSKLTCEIALDNEILVFDEYHSSEFQVSTPTILLFSNKDTNEFPDKQYEHCYIKYFESGGDYRSFILSNSSKLDTEYTLQLRDTPNGNFDGLKLEKKLRDFLKLSTL